MQCRRPRFNPWVGKFPCRRDRLPTPVFLGFPCGSAGKESTCNAGDLGSIPGLGRSPGKGKGYPLQYSGLENSTDCIVQGVTTSWTRLSNFHFTSPHFTFMLLPVRVLGLPQSIEIGQRPDKKLMLGWLGPLPRQAGWSQNKHQVP